MYYYKLLLIPLFFSGFMAGYYLLKKSGRVTQDNKFQKKVILSLLGIFAGFVSIAAYIRLNYDIEPLIPRFYRMHGTHFKWWGIESIFLIFSGFSLGLYMKEERNTIIKLVLTVVLLLSAIFYGDYYYTRPIYNLCKNRIENGIVYQSFQSTCGPASVCNLLKQFGITVTEKQIARLAGSRFTGTSGEELVEAVKKLKNGLCARYFKLNIDQINLMGLPCVISFDEEHFIVLTGRKKHLYTYICPSIGMGMIKEKDLLKQWDNKVMYVYPADFNFHLKYGDSDDRFKRIKDALRKKYPEISKNKETTGVYDEITFQCIKKLCESLKYDNFRSKDLDPFMNLLILSHCEENNFDYFNQ